MKYSVCLCKMSLKWVFLRLACLFDHQVSNFSLRLLVTTCVSGCPGLKLKNPPGYWKVSRTFRCDAFLWNTYRWLMHVTSISHHVPNRESELTARRTFHMTTSLGVQQRKRCLWLFLPVSHAVKHFLHFVITSPLWKKNKISDLNLPSLSCFGDCMSGNDEVLAVDDTDTRSPVRWTKNSSSTVHKTQETNAFLL